MNANKRKKKHVKFYKNMTHSCISNSPLHKQAYFLNLRSFAFICGQDAFDFLEPA